MKVIEEYNYTTRNAGTPRVEGKAYVDKIKKLKKKRGKDKNVGKKKKK